MKSIIAYKFSSADSLKIFRVFWKSLSSKSFCASLKYPNYNANNKLSIPSTSTPGGTIELLPYAEFSH
jgi:hypothetical protein